MKPINSLFGLTLSCTLFGLSSIAEAVDRDVCPSTCTYGSIQSAIDAALPGDRVLVGTPGRSLPEFYYENIVMKSGVDVVSEGGVDSITYVDPWGSHQTTTLLRTLLTIIQGNGTDAVVTFPGTITTDVTFEGFTVENVGSSAPVGTPLIEVDANAPTIQNMLIRNNMAVNGTGIHIASNAGKGVIQPTIQNNLIHYLAGGGIENGDYTAANILDNEIYPSAGFTLSMGIELMGKAAPVIRGNRIFDCGRVGISSVVGGVDAVGLPIRIKGNTLSDIVQAGIYIIANESAVQVEIGGRSEGDGNAIYRAMAGVFIQGNPVAKIDSVDIVRNSFIANSVGLRLQDVNNLRVEENEITHSVALCGIRLTDNQNSLIEDNQIHSNKGCGISIEGDAAALVRDNVIHSNGWAGIRTNNNASGVITRNEIRQNGYAGIALQSSGTFEITRNTLLFNTRGGIRTGMGKADGDGFSGSPGSVVLTVRQNEISNNGMGGIGGGMDIRHASGGVYNNLVIDNRNGGIRYGDWLDEIINNTVYGNGLASGLGGGIVYDDLAGSIQEPIGGMDPPQPPYPPEMAIRNNLVSKSDDAGIRDGICWRDPENPQPPAPLRDYNIFYDNNNTSCQCIPGQLGLPYESCLRTFCVYEQTGGSGCLASPGELFQIPQLADPATGDFRLLAGSPAIDAGDPDPAYDDIDGSRNDMGAYGGPTPVDYLFPGITGVYGRVGSADLVVKFTRGVYGNSDGTGDLTTGDFVLTDVDDSRGISLMTHTAGDDTAQVTLSAPLDAADDIGTDTLGAATAASIYDGLGLAMDTTAATISETVPSVSNMSPADGEAAASWDSNLTFTLADAGSGVDWSTFSIQLSGSLGYAQTYTGADVAVVSRTGGPDAYQVTVNPGANFGHNELITVTVNADNLGGGSMVPPSWSFTAVVPNPLILHPSGLESVFNFRPPVYSVPTGGDWADVLDTDDGATTGVESYATSNASQYGYQPEQEKPTNFNLHMDDVDPAAPLGTINQISVSAVVKPLYIGPNPGMVGSVLICYTLPGQGERCSQDISYGYYSYSSYMIWYTYSAGFPLTPGDDYKEFVFVDTNVAGVSKSDLDSMQVRIWAFANVEWNPAYTLLELRMHTTEVSVAVDYTPIP